MDETRASLNAIVNLLNAVSEYTKKVIYVTEVLDNASQACRETMCNDTLSMKYTGMMGNMVITMENEVIPRLRSLVNMLQTEYANLNNLLDN